MFISADFRIFEKVLTLWKSFTENYNQRKKSFNLISAEFISLRKLFDSAEVFPQNLQHKGDILYDFQKKMSA